MSVGAGILAATTAATSRTAVRESARAGMPARTQASPEIVSLARQAFFPSEAERRQRVLFVGADAQTNVLSVAEQVARALAEMQKTVSLVELQAQSGDAFPARKPPMAVRNVEYWSGFQVAENFWRIPSSTLSGPASSHAGGVFGTLPFECVVLASSIGDAITPLFLGICDGAVLTLTAHKTRRETALRARQMLEQFNVKLVGVVLDGRTFPMPEAIYRRL